MVNLGEKEILKSYYSVYNTDTLRCYICRNPYEPTNKDVSTKNPNVYYRACGICRTRKMEYFKKYRAKKENEGDTL